MMRDTITNSNRSDQGDGRVADFFASFIASVIGLLTAVLFFALANGALANPVHSRDELKLDLSALKDTQSEYQTQKKRGAWAISFDNDILAPSTRDQDYTYGLSLSKRTGPDLAAQRPLSWLNSRLGIKRAFSQALEFGAYGFTPEDTSEDSAVSGDRPYASLVYVSTSQEHQTSNPNVIWKTSLSLGILGLDIVGDVQNEVHALTGSEKAEGWNKQISDGGEPSFRYGISRHRRWDTGLPRLEFKTSSALNVGYITEVSYSFNLRYGKIQSSWQSQSHDVAVYGEHSKQRPKFQSDEEHHWLLGAAIKARAYNVFLQEQFKHNDYSYDASDLNHGLFEAWGGYSRALWNNYRLTYVLRGHTSEVKHGIANRNVLWGGLTLSRTI